MWIIISIKYFWEYFKELRVDLLSYYVNGLKFRFLYDKSFKNSLKLHKIGCSEANKLKFNLFKNYYFFKNN